MRRWIPITIFVVTLVLAAMLLVVYFAYGIRDQAPRSVDLQGLSAPVRISWHSDEAATIEASSEADFLTALGYAHGQQRSWTVALWRQTAEGRLSEWFGESAFEIDRAARRLGLARQARLSYRQLDDETQALMQAYARGMNAALLGSGSRAREFALLGIEPGAWQPWHALAVERLMAWLGTPEAQTDTIRNADEELVAFSRDDRALRRFLHLGGFAHGAAWSVRDSNEVVFVQRHVTGASALPVFYEVREVVGDSTRFIGASLPGTPYFPMGRSTQRAWSVLLSSDIRSAASVVVAATVDTVYDRVELADGDERLVSTAVAGSQLVLGRIKRPVQVPFPPAGVDSVALQGDQDVPPTLPVVPADSVLMLSWPGFLPITDASAWLRLRRNETPEFRLYDGVGLVFESNGQAQVLGTPAVIRSHPDGMFVSNSPLASYLAERLDSLGLDVDRTQSDLPYLDDCHSTWAAQLEPRLVAAIDSAYNHPRFLEEALTYLRNWDFSYDRTSIAASIFDHWMRAHRDSTGSLPMPAMIDTSLTARHRLYSSLIGSVNLLANEFGTDMSQWRWEVTEPHVFEYPVWSADSLTRSRSLSETRYAPIQVSGEGHPTTLCWGPSPVLDEVSHPGHWEAWISTGSWDRLHVRRRRLDGDAFLSRYRISDGPPAAVVIGPEFEVTGTTRLNPSP